jgi:hypothetical protein
MPNPTIDRLIQVHQHSLDLCRSLVTNGLSGRAQPDEMNSVIVDEAGCEFTKILQAGTLSFDGEIAAEVVVALHGTFHSIATLILTLVTTKSESAEIGSYIGALNSVSNQLIAVLSSAKVH